MMKFALTTLYVKDMEKSLFFYHELLGMPVLRRLSMGPGREMVFLGTTGDVNLELIASDATVTYAGFSIGFDVDDLVAAKERLAANGYVIKREINPAPTVTLAFFNGPNGEEVELMGH